MLLHVNLPAARSVCLKFLIAILVLLFHVTLFADMPSPGRKYTTIERMEEKHLAAVHQARLRLAQQRRPLPQTGSYIDYRAVIHVHAQDAAHTKGTRAEVLTAAKADGVSIVMLTDHNGPMQDTWSGMRDGVLFFAGSEDGALHQLRFPSPDGEMRFMSHVEETPNATGEGFWGMEIYNRHADEEDEQTFEQHLGAALKNPKEWSNIARLESLYPDEMFGAGTDYWPTNFAMWDRELAKHSFTGISANDSHKNQTYNGVTFDPYEVGFRSVTTHILAPQLTQPAIREALRNGRVYVAHDWLCDPTGFSFTAVDGNAIYGMGDHVPMLASRRLKAIVPVAADLRIIHNGTIVAETRGTEIDFTPVEAGAYRMEAWLSIDDEQRPWIYANPIYLEPRR